MDVWEAIRERRSIRRFKPDPIPDEVLTRVLEAATLAPSGKNSQPWRFVVVKEDKRAEMIAVLHEGIAACAAQGLPPGSSKHTAAIMEQAPVTVFVFNTAEKNLFRERRVDEVLWNVACVQSIGAAIQNLSLAALAEGVGSLWICDVYYAYEELRGWLGEPYHLVAAMSLGYPDEAPPARPRKPLAAVTRVVK